MSVEGSSHPRSTFSMSPPVSSMAVAPNTFPQWLDIHEGMTKGSFVQACCRLRHVDAKVDNPGIGWTANYVHPVDPGLNSVSIWSSVWVERPGNPIPCDFS